MHMPLLFCLVLVASVSAQTVYIDNNNPTTGTSNTFPWGQANGFTTLHVYTAAQLTAGGVCPGATLVDVAIAPSAAGTGTYNAPQARLSIGHLASDPPIAGAWESNLASPTVVHDLTSGPYTFPYTLNTWSPLPGISTAGFAWDGVTSIAIFYTSSAGTTGTFAAHRTSTNLRHAVAVFNATNQAPSSNGLFAMKVRLTFTGGGGYQVNQAGASLDIDGTATGPCAPAVLTRGIGVSSTLTIGSNLIGAGYEIAYTTPDPVVPVGGGATVLPGSGQIVNLDIGAPSLGFLNGLTFPPFPGTIAMGITIPFPFTFTAQLAVIDGANPDGLVLSGPVTLIVQ